MEKKTTIVIPFHNEEASVTSLLREIRQIAPSAEIIAINDGSSDSTEQLLRRQGHIKLISFSENRGQSAATHAGLMSATGEYIVIMDGDGQHDPRDIPILINSLASADFVCGYRRNRKDTSLRVISSLIANTVRRIVLKDNARDTGSIKAIRKSHVRHLDYFDGMHRYIPSILANANLVMKEVPVRHRPRTSGKTHYSILGRGIKGIRDIVKVRALLKQKNNGSYPVLNW